MATLYATIRYLEKQGMHKAAAKVQTLDERLADVESDQRLSSDPLIALAAVMREHKLTVIADGGVIIASGDSVIVADQRFELTADDIKPEASND